MVDTPEFPLAQAVPPADEFRFLALQCEGQANSPHRDQDRQFIRNLIATLFRVVDCSLLDFSARLIADAHGLQDDDLPGLLKQAATDFRLHADALEISGRAA